MSAKDKLWGGRFQKKPLEAVERYTDSLADDHCLALYDIAGSISHAKMLARCKIISEKEKDKIVAGLQGIFDEIAQDKITFESGPEDIHTLVEQRLIEKIGDAGAKLHTARSRNDQVVLDTRLFLLGHVTVLVWSACKLIEALIEQAEANLDTVMPGYTHLQRAQPVLLAHHLLAYVEMFERDIERLVRVYATTDKMPLGSAALAGTSFPVDREFLLRDLGLSELTQNSIDAVSNRDFVIEFCAGAAIAMMHLSRLSEELVLWSTKEFDFVQIDETFTTGSSIMPQKKNPDVAELCRGRTGRVYGNLVCLLTVMKGLPLAYNRDMQEDKRALSDSIFTLLTSLDIMGLMVRTLKFNKDKMRAACLDGFLNATDLADYLVGKRIPFRKAHEIVGRVVLFAESSGRRLEELSLTELRSFCPKFQRDVQRVLQIDNVVNARDVLGGTARKRVKSAITAAKRRLKSKRE